MSTSKRNCWSKEAESNSLKQNVQYKGQSLTARLCNPLFKVSILNIKYSHESLCTLKIKAKYNVLYIFRCETDQFHFHFLELDKKNCFILPKGVCRLPWIMMKIPPFLDERKYKLFKQWDFPQIKSMFIKRNNRVKT